MSDNTRYVARVPIVPDDFENKNVHKNHELVMDFNTDDIYLKKDDQYINITGDLKEEIKEAIDQATTIHIATESTVPAVRDRKENHWYYIITKAKEQSSQPLTITSYIYYGLIKSLDRKNLLIGQNAIVGTDSVKITIVDGYQACFYVPTYFDASFTNHNTGDPIPFEIKDTLYAMNAMYGTYEPYNVYILDLSTAGDYFIDITITENDAYIVSFSTNDSTVEELVLPDPKDVHQGLAIGTISDPTWSNPRYIFHGWSTSEFSKMLIDPSIYIPERDMTLYAWFTYNDDPSLVEYYSDYSSTNS